MKRKKRHAKSIIQSADDRQRCYLCMMMNDDYTPRRNLETHHVLFGMGRREKAEADGLKVRLCREHHAMVHNDDSIRQRLCAVAQTAWEREHLQEYGSKVREKWMERYIKNYRRDSHGAG